MSSNLRHVLSIHLRYTLTNYVAHIPSHKVVLAMSVVSAIEMRFATNATIQFNFVFSVEGGMVYSQFLQIWPISMLC